MAAHTKKHELTIPLTFVCIPDEEGMEASWSAHCLEMDLSGFGDTEREAIDELKGMVAAQVRSAVADNDPSTLYRRAPQLYWDIAAADAMKNAGSPGGRSTAKNSDLPAAYRVSHQHLPLPATQ